MGGRAAEMTTSRHAVDAPPLPPAKAMAWDPTSTATLALPLCRPPPSSSTSRTAALGLGFIGGGIADETQRSDGITNNNKNDNIGVFLSHDGTGCPAEETECLIQCLDARDAWMAAARRLQLQSRTTTPRTTTTLTVTELSMEYRVAMCKCLMQLQEKAERRLLENNDANASVAADVSTAAASAAAAGGENDSAHDTNLIEEGNNMELLLVTYAISHLAEIFLLPSLADSSASSNTMSASHHYASNINGELFTDPSTAAVSRRLDGPAGSLTADTVRYLRKHHSKGVAFYMELPQVQSMLESDQPEYYRFTSTSSTPDNNVVIPGPFELPFWNLLFQLVIEGNLSAAWTLLSQHSACRHAERDIIISPDGQGFEILQRILLSAPLPGGRGDRYCDDSGLDDYFDEDMLEREEEEEEAEAEESRSSSGGRTLLLRHDQYHESDASDLDDIYFEYIDGVSSNAYLLWEALPRRADRIRMLRYHHNRRLHGGGTTTTTTADMDGSGSPTVPELYQPRVALNAFRVWQNTVREIAFPPAGIRSSIGPSSAQGVLAGLFRRFPPLQHIVSILVGEALPSLESSSSISWEGRLLMELLYSRPDIVPEDIAVRAKVAMDAAGTAYPTNSLTTIILSIMQGSAGQVIDTIFSVCGGSSGAALPATIVSVNYCPSSMSFRSSTVNHF